ncbi:MAG: hypothetical protein M1514_00295, partial [Patescibacteria group bacterium]|nr:hypothetical protein [Patescibacteria group bacterium]
NFKHFCHLLFTQSVLADRRTILSAKTIYNQFKTSLFLSLRQQKVSFQEIISETIIYCNMKNTNEKIIKVKLLFSQNHFLFGDIIL